MTPEQKLKAIANLAHCGGLANMSEADTLIEIRRITIGDWRPAPTEAGMREQVVVAQLAAKLLANQQPGPAEVHREIAKHPWDYA